MGKKIYPYEVTYGGNKIVVYSPTKFTVFYFASEDEDDDEISTKDFNSLSQAKKFIDSL